MVKTPSGLIHTAKAAAPIKKTATKKTATKKKSQQEPKWTGRLPKDKKLADFYRKLMISEANHYTIFLKFARQYGVRSVVDQKWQDLLEFEAKIMKDLSKSEQIHG